MTKDPVCGMQINPDSSGQAARKSEYKGKTYYFCSDDCKVAFDQEPAKYADKTEAGSQPHHH